MPSDSAHPDRHHRQRILPEIGDAGQERLRHAHAAIIGCGALGTHLADTLCRAGVGWLTIIDRDIVEHTNLQRQILFTEDHANRAVPKAEAAREALRAIDPNCHVRAIVDDLNPDNIEDLLPLPPGEGRGESVPNPNRARQEATSHQTHCSQSSGMHDPHCSKSSGTHGSHSSENRDVTSPSRPAGGGRGEGLPQATHSSESCATSRPSPAGRRWRPDQVGITDEGLDSFPPITLLLDGTDNFETRFLLNDLAVARAVPLVYAGVIGTTGLLTTVLPASPSRPAGGGRGEAVPNPNRARQEAASHESHCSQSSGTHESHCSQSSGTHESHCSQSSGTHESHCSQSSGTHGSHSSESCAASTFPSRPAGGGRGEGSDSAPLPYLPTPCLRCLFNDAPPPGSAPTCDTAGVLGPAVSIIAGFQAAEALKILTGDFASVTRALLEIDAWRTTTRRIDTTNARNPDCPCCAHRRFDHLDALNATNAVSLCGRNAVQITPGARAAIDLPALAARLAPHGDFHTTDHLLRGVLHTEPIELTVFPTGRAIIKGVEDAAKARAIYARFVGV